MDKLLVLEEELKRRENLIKIHMKRAGELEAAIGSYLAHTDKHGTWNTKILRDALVGK